MQLIIDEKEISFHVQYSKRKKMTLEITPEGHITVKAPTKTSIEEINAFMRSNKSTLLRVVTQLENRRYITREKTYTEDENYLFQGKAYTLSTLLNTPVEELENPQAALKQFYTTKTKELIKVRVKHYEKIIGVKAKSVTIVESAKTWGTCSSNKDLTFNYKLSMAPLPVMDYVVIHELCHILHMNHDRSFWRVVGKYDPDFKAHTAYLARFGGVMTI